MSVSSKFNGCSVAVGRVEAEPAGSDRQEGQSDAETHGHEEERLLGAGGKTERREEPEPEVSQGPAGAGSGAAGAVEEDRAGGRAPSTALGAQPAA